MLLQYMDSNPWWSFTYFMVICCLIGYGIECWAKVQITKHIKGGK